MSDSRLEKFIYAICSMDVSDLPVPLSRIEKLWNCLITGETPDFEPLSRNEKYLMAMLDRYDISNLPAPISRGEKLLYKIAVGETDLSDVPGYLSRYEELLKYLIENGGIGFEYVLYTINQSLYTLYTTAEKPVKSAILKGQTLVNISSLSGEITIKPNSTQFIESSLIQQNKTFTFMFNCTSVPSTGFIEFRQILDNTALKMENINVVQGYNKFKVTTVNKEVNKFRLKNDSTSNTDFVFNNLLILDGDYINIDVPYFEGMQSVKLPVLTTTGKNLWDNKIFENCPIATINNDGSLTLNGTLNQHWMFKYTIDKGTYSSSAIGNDNGYIHMFWGGGDDFFQTKKPFNIAEQITRDGYIAKGTYDNINIKLQLEQGSTTTSYEPYKSNILTVNEPVELRGIGNVQDELDCLTGEVVERIGEIVLDGSENWANNENIMITKTNTIGFYRGNNGKHALGAIISDNLREITDNEMYSGDVEGINSFQGNIRIRIAKNKLLTQDVAGFKQYLSQNPITVQYHLATESIKTVDLTTVDQDNQPTQLGTFENITHVSLESAGLIPEVEMEVATRISKELASASPLMDDISMKQEQLNTTVDEQSNNVDATMIATTEIYEEIL